MRTPPLRPALAVVLLCALVGASACGEQAAPNVLVVDYPPEGAVFPREFVPPTFLWHDDAEGVDRWRIELAFQDDGEPLRREVPGDPPVEGEIDPAVLGPTNEIYAGTPYQQSARTWTPEVDTWAEIQRRSVEAPVRATLVGFSTADPERTLSQGAVSFLTSEDPVGAPIFYRDVPLAPSDGEAGLIKPLATALVPLIAWRLRDVARARSKVVLEGMPTCANCHSFSADGGTLAMDVDGPQGDKGSYAIAPLERNTVIGRDEVISWNSFPDKPKDHKTIGFLSRISPDGEVALTTLNESLYVANFRDFRFLQVFFPTRGILAWYSKATDEMKALPGADDPEYVHCDPAWTPDGTHIVFARARAFDPYEPGKPLATHPGDPAEPRIQYDLYRMPFDEGRGGTPIPIAGASANGMSNTFPKVSPDGKWVVFTQCENGQLLRPDGRLWIVPAEGGEAREMRCNTSLMNSWHSFSPNGRWMVFSSKANTPYTQMFLTHLDEDGNDTPAVLLPNSTAANRAVNLPEFLNASYDALDGIDVPAVDHHRLYTQGRELVEEGRYEEAIPVLEGALEKEPVFSRALAALGLALLEEGRMEPAKERLRRALDVDPHSSSSHNLLGLAFHREGRNPEAIAELRLAIQYDFLNGDAHHNLGLALLAEEKRPEALQALAEAARLQPDHADVLNDYGYALGATGDAKRGIEALRRALEIDPGLLLARKNLAYALMRAGDLRRAHEQYLVASTLAPEDPSLLLSLALTSLKTGAAKAGLEALERLLRLRPEDAQVHRVLAWNLATLPDDTLRDGPRALLHAEKSLSLSAAEDAAGLDVLAAAHAEAGRFDEALVAARRARDAMEAGAGRTVPGLEERIAGYEAGRPHRQARAPGR